MKKKALHILTIILILVSCSNKYHLSKHEIKLLNKEIDEMYEKDQTTRRYFGVIDSIYGLDKDSRFLSYNLKEEMLGQKYIKYKKEIDSLWVVINKIDNKNTPKLIEITKRHGFPSNQRLGVYKAKAYFLFVHAPQEYFDEINSLIDKEYKEGRIDEYQMSYIFWHTKKQRKGMPPRKGKNGEVVW